MENLSLVELLYLDKLHYSYSKLDTDLNKQSFEEEYSDFITNRKTDDCNCVKKNECKCGIYFLDYNWSIKRSKSKNYDNYLYYIYFQSFEIVTYGIFNSSVDNNKLFKVSNNLYKFMYKMNDKDFDKILKVILNKKLSTVFTHQNDCTFISVTGIDIKNREFVATCFLEYEDVDTKNKDEIYFTLNICYRNSYETTYLMSFNLITKTFGNVRERLDEPVNIIDNESYVIFKTILFLEFVEVETKHTYINPKAKSTFNKRQGLVKPKSLRIINADINYNFNLVSTGDFKVTSHFRLQPYGTQKDKHKLIFINEFVKHGYNKKATAVR